MAWPLNWANVSLLLLSQRGSECRVRPVLFQKEEKKNVSKSLCSFHWEVVTTDLTFAQVFTYACTFATLFLP